MLGECSVLLVLNLLAALLNHTIDMIHQMLLQGICVSFASLDRLDS